MQPLTSKRNGKDIPLYLGALFVSRREHKDGKSCWRLLSAKAFLWRRGGGFAILSGINNKINSRDSFGRLMQHLTFATTPQQNVKPVNSIKKGNESQREK